MRCATGEAWQMIMFDLARTYSETYQCREDETYSSVMANGGEPFACGQPVVAYTFFIIFQILVSQIIVNLFIAIIIDAFLGQSDQFDLPISPYHLYDFVEIWSRYDPEATGFISIHDLEQFIIDLASSPEGFNLVIFHNKVLNSKTIRKRFITKLNIPMYYQLKKVSFIDTLQ